MRMFQEIYTKVSSEISPSYTYEDQYGPRRQKTCLGGLRTTQAQTNLRIRAV